MFSAFKRTRKASPRPGDRNGSDAANQNEKGVAYRRRATDTESNGTLLPSSLLPSKRPVPAKRNISRNLPIYTSPGTSTCNTFLLGGQYYPGKDKKRRHMRKKTIWHRIFCSSPWRMLLSSILITYLLLWHIVVPLTETLMDYGKILSGGVSKRLDRAASISLPALEDQKLHSQRIHDERLRYQYQQKRKSQLLEKIVPDWYHRNEAFRDETKKQPQKGKQRQPADVKDKEKLQAREEHDIAKLVQVKETRGIGSEPPIIKEGTIPKAKNKLNTEAIHEIEIDSANDSSKASEKSVDLVKENENEPAQHIIETGDVPVDPIKMSDTHLAREANPPNTDQEIKNLGAKANNPEDKEYHKIKKPPSLVSEEMRAIPKIDKKVAESNPIEAANKVPRVKGRDKNNSSEIGTEDTTFTRTILNTDGLPNQSRCPADLSPNNLTATLMTQCSLDRMWILNETCQRWKDPIIAVVYVTKSESVPNIDEWQQTCPHLTVIPYKATDTDLSWGYPVNRLRNIGLDAVWTSHVLVMDVDFVPSMNLHITTREILRLRKKQRVLIPDMIPDNLDAIVIPAFERVLKDPCETAEKCGVHLKTDSSFIPRTIDDLRGCVKDENCAVFQSSNNWEGHHSTRSASWLEGHYYSSEVTLPDNSTTPMLNQVSCFDSLRYEPYVVIRWCPSGVTSSPKPVAPYYDERFYGYGKNKIEMISHLRFMGYQFSILPEGFIVHNPHPESEAKKVWNDVNDFKLHENMDSLYPMFLRDLAHKYSNMTRYIVKQCDHEKRPRVGKGTKVEKKNDSKKDEKLAVLTQNLSHDKMNLTAANDRSDPNITQSQ